MKRRELPLAAGVLPDELLTFVPEQWVDRRLDFVGYRADWGFGERLWLEFRARDRWKAARAEYCREHGMAVPPLFVSWRDQDYERLA